MNDFAEPSAWGRNVGSYWRVKSKKKITSIFDSVPKLSSEQESVAFRGVTLQPISTEA